MNKLSLLALGAAVFGIMTTMAPAYEPPSDANNFYKSDKVEMHRIMFQNQYRMNVVANLFIPKNLDYNQKAPAIIVGHPIGAVKEQAASLYATKMAEQGFVTLAMDLPYWGESDGQPRNAIAPDVYAETYMAAVDYLGTRPYIDKERIGAIGICAGGGFAISAAKIDPRIKAVATVSMYDMGAAARNGLRKSVSLEQRKQIIADAAEQRYVEYQGGAIKYIPGTVHEIDENSNPIEIEFYEFYRTPRGEHVPAGMARLQTTQPMFSTFPKFMNFYPFNDIETISPRPMMFVAGENAHSIEFSEDAYRLAAEPKELVLIPNAGHVDLYDRVNVIPFDRITTFFKTNLK